MTPQLFPYQEEGAEWLSRHRLALLADEMGLGKSAQAIHAADAILAERILIVCPAVVRINWQREFDKFSTFKRRFFIPMKVSDIPPNDATCFIYSYDLLRLQKNPFQARRFDLVIIDEAHFVKGITTKRAKYVLGAKEGVVRRADRVWALTGTPMPNHAGELWTIAYSFGKTQLSYEDFINRYCNINHLGFVTGTKKIMIPELRAMLSPMMKRRLKRDVLPQLPPILRCETFVNRGNITLSPDMTHRVQQELRALETKIENISNQQAVGILEAMAGSCSTLRRYIGMQKVEAATHLIHEELASGYYSKVVIFCIHVEVVAMLRTYFSRAGMKTVVIDGHTCPQLRQEEVDSFQNDPDCPVFIGNIQAAGTGITLTASAHVIFVEQEWTPSSNEQALNRCHRIGQDKTVTVRVLTVEGSIDERINAVLRRKQEEISAVIE